MSSGEHTYPALLDFTSVGIYQSDRDGNPIFVNKALRRQLGLDGDINLKTLLSRVHPDDRGWLAERWQQMLRDGVGGMSVYRLVGTEGQITWVQGRGEPVRDEKGQVTGFASVIIDVTAEHQLRLQAEQLSKLYATLSQVTSSIIHCRDEATLYARITEIMVEWGGVTGAFLYVADWPRHQATLVASAGAWQEDVRRLNATIDLDDTNTTRGPAFLTLRSGVATTIDDAQNDARLPLYHQFPRGAGPASLSAMPFLCGNEVVATLVLTSAELGFFNAEILALLEEVGRDISFALENFARERQRREAEAALAHSEENLRVTLRSIGDAVLATDSAGRVTMMNPVAEALIGWSEAEARGRPVGEVFHIINEETRAVVASPIDIVLRDGAVVGLANHTLLIARDGTERPIADSGAPIRRAEGDTILGVVLVFRDQSEEHRVQKTLRDSERRYVALVEMLPAAVVELDRDGTAIYLNPAARAMSGVDASASTQEWLAEIHPDDRNRVLACYGEAIGGKRTDFDYRFVRPDGRTVWVQSILVPKLDDDNQPQGFLGVSTDVTEERQQWHRAEQLSRLYATLSQVNSAIVHCRDEEELYARIVATMVERGGFAGASLYVADWPRRQAILAATAGDWEEDVRRLTASVDLSDANTVRGPVFQTLRSGVAMTIDDAQNDARCFPLYRQFLQGMGPASVSTVPFFCGDEAADALILTAAEQGFFSADILALLEEVGRDVSFALETFAGERRRRKAEAAQARNEERLRLTLSVTRTGTYEVDYRANRITMSAVAMRQLGLGNEEFDTDIDAFIKLLPGEDKGVTAQAHREIMMGNRNSYTGSRPVRLPDGTMSWVMFQGALTAERDAAGKPVRMFGMVTDITEAKRLEERQRLAATVFDNSGEAIMIIGADLKVMMVNRAFSLTTGYTEEEVLGVAADKFKSDRYDEAFYADVAEVLRRDGAWQGEVWRRRKNGDPYPARLAITAVQGPDGEVTHCVLQSTDISQQKEYEERISHLAYRDALTDLPNRALLRDRVEQSVASAQRDGSTLALLFLDLDHFKNINDSLGHAVGDHLLKEIARRLTDSVRVMDTVGRLGGDEFLLLLPGADADAAGHVAQKLLEESARTFNSGAHTLTITPSIGIALYPKDGETYDDLLKTADTAMYRAKDEGRNAYRFYTPEMNQVVFQRMVLESSLRHAIENKEFVLHYQPKFELREQTLIGIEALIRWHQPEMGMISPAQFIPVAEESGLIEVIGKWVLKESCRQARIWRDLYAPTLCVAINFSARQFAAKNVAELVTAALEEAGVPGSALEMEITESLLAQDMDHTLAVLQSLKKQGVLMAVDDFGTGYSSLSYLKRFPIDRLKIDQSFVRDLVVDADDRAIAAAVVTLGHALGLRVIAEGVETAQQMDILSRMGCDEVQGYFLGRPMPAEEMTILLQAAAAKSSRAV